MGLRGGVGCLLALFAGLLWLESTVSTAYFHHRSLKKSANYVLLIRAMDSRRLWTGRFSVVLGVSPLIHNREFNNLTVDSLTKPLELRKFWRMF